MQDPSAVRGPAVADRLVSPHLAFRTSRPSDCPSEIDLQRLLDGTLPAADQPTLEAHIQTCSGCQQTLDQLTAFASGAWLPGPDKPTTTPLKPEIENYELAEEVGRGGYGIVYRARDVRLGRTVAVKVLKHGALADAPDRARFLTEARAAARLAHPHIVPVFEVGEADGIPYIVMEFMAGGPLSRRLDGTPLPAREAASLVETLARAVDYAHGQGVLHRDLKPGNVLVHGPEAGQLAPPLGPALCPKVADFGTARLLDTPHELTPTQAVLGTPSYMAPEQAGGRSRQVGPPADVYSLGAILYELLTGRAPFKAATPFETLLLVRDQEPVPVRRLNPAVPRDLETVALKCLEKDPTKRYPSAGALADDLGRWRAGRPILARPVGVVGKAVRWARRHPAASLLTGALVLLAIASLATVTVLWRRSVERGELAERRRDEIQAREKLATEALDRSVLLIGGWRGKSVEVLPREREAIGEILGLYERLLAETNNDPAARWKLVRVSEVIANIYWFVGDPAQADRIHLRAIELLEGLAAEFPDDPECRFELARHLTGITGGHASSLSRQEAVRKSVDILSALRASDPARRDWAVQHANNLTLLARYDPARSDGLLADAQAICRTLLVDNPTDHDVRLIEAATRITRGTNAARYRGDLAAGYEASVAGIELFKEFRRNRPAYSEGLDTLGSCFYYAANFAWGLGKRAEAVRHLRDGVDNLEAAADRFKKFTELRHLHFLTTWRLGDALWLMDQPRATVAYAAARKQAHELLPTAHTSGYVRHTLVSFFCFCPAERYRDRDIVQREPFRGTLLGDHALAARLFLAEGRPGEAFELLTRWRAAAGERAADPPAHRFVDLLEALAVWQQGDRTAARRLSNSAWQRPDHLFDRAIEFDLLREEVEKAIGTGGGK